MKKNNLMLGILYAILGSVFLIIAISHNDNKLSGVLWGLTGAMAGMGFAMIYKYIYWTRPKNKERYAEMLENERIDMHDELKEKLRDKSGRYAYVIALVVIALSMMVFSILSSLEIIKEGKLIVLYLGGLLVFLYVVGIIIYKRLLDKY
ncbi:hypothetical protein [Anaerofustis stercorihominis]|uniref:hypothetical protein n=1 Tax=Anaerofustis stercorihominis TaxID=214853 RepID=UPI00214C40A2|nr:hypothetical protein [Anaerofustis stercorihominis]MCR2033563.1 hypothetical protein [Anaerofustis stercorihominis]